MAPVTGQTRVELGLSPRPNAAELMDRALLEACLDAGLRRRGQRLQHLRRAVTRLRGRLIETTCDADTIGPDGTITPVIAGLRRDLSAASNSVELMVSPEDPRLPGGDALRADFGSDLALFLERDPGHLIETSTAVAAHRFGSRIAWNVKLRFEEAETDLEVMVRIRKRSPGADLRLLVDSGRVPWPVPLVAQPDRHWPLDGRVCRTVRPWIAGTPLHEILRSGDAGRFDFRRAGRALAMFHQRARLYRATGPLPVRSARDETATLRNRRDDVRRLFDGTGPMIDKPIERLITEAESAALTAGPLRVLHGDLHDKQILESGDDIAFIDLDQAALGEPELDAGNLIAHVFLRAFQNDRPRDEAAHSAAAFLTGYREGRPLQESRLRFYTRTSLVRLALLYAMRLDAAHLPSLLIEEERRLLRSEIS